MINGLLLYPRLAKPIPWSQTPTRVCDSGYFSWHLNAKVIESEELRLDSRFDWKFSLGSLGFLLNDLQKVLPVVVPVFSTKRRKAIARDESLAECNFFQACNFQSLSLFDRGDKVTGI